MQIFSDSRRGIAMFSVLFVMIIISIFALQFHFTSRQAKMSAHRFQTSEYARQLAMSAVDEVFMQLHNQTNIQGSTLFNKIVSLSSDINASANLSNRTSIGINIPVPLTAARAANMEDNIGDRFKIEATARIIDFRDANRDGAKYFGNEGVGTIEIHVVAEPKDANSPHTMGACTIIRHHDYRVVSIVSRRDNDAQRTQYANNYSLDYALFIKHGQEEFDDTDGLNINPPDRRITINAGSNPSQMGKVYFGNYLNNYVYLNIDRDRADAFIPDAVTRDKIATVNPDDVLSLLPKFKRTLEQEIDRRIRDEGNSAKLRSLGLDGQLIHFNYERHPITTTAIAGIVNLQQYRDITAAAFAATTGKNVADYSKFPPGIKLEPENQLSSFIEGDLRQSFFHFGNLLVDMSNAVLTINYSYKDWERKTKRKTEVLVMARDAPNIGAANPDQDDKLPCFNFQHLSKLSSNPNDQIDFEFLYNNYAIANPEILSAINTDYSYSHKGTATFDRPVFFNYESASPLDESAFASPPFSHVNLWHRRGLTIEQLGSLDIYDGKTLKLRGIINVDEDLVLGQNGVVEVEGQGVIIVSANRSIKIEAGIRKKPGTDSICVIISRGTPIEVNTSDLIEASLASISRDRRDGHIRVNGALNLKGSLAVDRLGIGAWRQGVEHKIEYDPALKRNDDLYNINISRWVSFERVVERDE